MHMNIPMSEWREENTQKRQKDKTKFSMDICKQRKKIKTNYFTRRVVYAMHLSAVRFNASIFDWICLQPAAITLPLSHREKNDLQKCNVREFDVFFLHAYAIAIAWLCIALNKFVYSSFRIIVFCLSLFAFFLLAFKNKINQWKFYCGKIQYILPKCGSFSKCTHEIKMHATGTRDRYK